MFVWGSTAHGQLGLGGIEDEQILSPKELNWSCSDDVDIVSCGTLHTLILAKGKVSSCGNNDHGQLGHDLSRKRPQPVSALDNYEITDISCGATHSMAINEWGQLFTWGSNICGQLAKETNELQNGIPKIVKVLATKHVVQIASGHYHSLALTISGDLYAWGANGYGQLGLGTITEKVITPTLIKSLAGIPIAFITCGANHSFVISKSGAVFGWGKNVFGQLGLNDDVMRPFPTQLKTLRSLGVRYISCGDDFSVFLTADGGILTCGCGTFGQLGHGKVNNDFLPRMVVELMGTSCTQISCGRRHTLTFVPSRGRIYGFGLGVSGQLGHRLADSSKIPQVVVGPWISPSGSTLIDETTDNDTMIIVRRIFSGGDHSITCTTKLNKNIKPYDCRIYDKRTQITSLSLELADDCVNVPKDCSVDMELMSLTEILFKSLACINSSFLFDTNGSGNTSCSSRYSGVDVAQAENVFDLLRKMENDALKQVIWDSITKDLIESLQPSPPDVETLRVYLILPLYHEFSNSKNYKLLHTPFGKALLQLTNLPKKCIKQWFATASLEYFESLVEKFKGVVTYIMEFKYNFKQSSHEKQYISYEVNIELALNVLQFLYQINHEQRIVKVPYDIFQFPELTDYADLSQDYLRWLFKTNSETNNFYLCNYPHIFDAKAKTLLLQTDQEVQMQNAMQNAASQTIHLMFGGRPTVAVQSQFITLQVTRENLVADTLREISKYGPNEMKKPVKVKFHNEEAEDAGGVRKEFFMLLLKDLLDPKYGMFKEFDDSRAIWFTENSFEGEHMFRLIGLLCGLAIYNFTIINLPFPLALYKKLLKEPVDLTDLNDLSPTLANSMKSLLNYTDADFEDVFGLTFCITQEIFGETRVIELKSNGEQLSVTNENKHEFVDLYIDYVFNKSVEKQFYAFYCGFMKVCGGRVLELFKSHELMAVVVGNEDYDWDALESEAQYKNGYQSGDETIRFFWEVFHDLPLTEKKKFLLFLTGSDRIPIQGMKAIKIYFQPINDDRCLPVAHTCFNLLDLPRYKTKERLKFKLCQAIQQTQGFSIV